MTKEEYLEKRIEILEMAVNSIISLEIHQSHGRNMNKYNYYSELLKNLQNADIKLEAEFKNDNPK